LVAEDGDCQQAADHVVRLLADVELKERLRASATALASSYSLERLSGSLVDFYGKLVGAPQSARV
jgi:glycosyltransferase involved in cell wall biosynthesis